LVLNNTVFFHTPLTKAITTRIAGIVSLLIRHGADVNVKNQDREMSFAESHAPSDSDSIPLILAIKYISPLMVEFILEKPILLELSLNVAVRLNNVRIVKMLIKAGANVNLEDTDNETPLVRATKTNSLVIAELLIDAGADVNETVIGSTLLMRTVFERDIDMMKLLLRKGAKMNKLNSDSRTALHLAIDAGNVEGAILLILAGADVSVRSGDRKTALELAEEKKLTTVVAAIKNILEKKKK